MGFFDVLVPPAGTGTATAAAPAVMPGNLGTIGTPAPANDWRCALLTALGAPCSSANLKVLAFWHQSEGTALSTNNWLAITDPGNKWPHAGVVANNGGNPVYAFPDMATGVAATAAFLRGSYYTNVVASFKSDAGMAAIFSAINHSPWCAGCQGGHYPVALYQALGNPSGPDPGPGGGGSTAGGGGQTAIQPSKPDEPGAKDCFLGPFVMPGNVPNIPCLLSRSNLWAMAGAISLVTGGAIMLVGAILLVSKAAGVREAAAMIPDPTGRLAGVGSRSGSVSRTGLAQPLQTEEQVADTNNLLAQQREAESRPPPSVRRVRPGGIPRNARRSSADPQAARARRTRRPANWRADIAASTEEPF